MSEDELDDTFGDEDEDGLDDEQEEDLPETLEDLHRFLAEGMLTPQEDEQLQRAFGPDAPRPLDVAVIGAARPGGCVGIVARDGAWLTDLSPWTWRPGLRGSIRRAAGGAQRPGLWGSLVAFHPQLLRVLWGALSVIGAVVVVAITVWDESGDWFLQVVIVAMWAVSGFNFAVGEGGVSLSEGRLRLLGLLRDEVVVPSGVRLMTSHENAVALRLDHADEVVVVEAAGIVGRFDATGAEALERLELWRSLGDTTARPGLRPSYLTWGAIATILAGLGAAAALLV